MELRSLPECSPPGIVATIGPVSANREMLLALDGAGMTMARLNGSHNTSEWHRRTIRLIKETLPGIPVLLDIPGRKIRTIPLVHEPAFRTGDVIILTTDRQHDGSIKIPVNFDQFHEFMMPGLEIHADDGHLSFTVEKVYGRDVHIRANVDGVLRSRKGVNVPQARFERPLVTNHDREMMAFVQENDVDFVGISFVESAGHVAAIRDLITQERLGVVSKLENQEGLDHMDEVIATSNMVMIDRGDLAVETSPELVCLFQKSILAAAQRQKTPVIVATELLNTMIEHPYPTKAEISDITNAVLDGARFLMLSGETAIGSYPVEATSRLQRIGQAVSTYIHQRS
ncbi:pyruvate kinase [Komagataeibacter medellinensis NBRC 3288]|uniref:Pyruvate kinase n=1 Tax=Komagataeibacter medellinensis (strain NBRC 3288 / BCRC 11682 / LMG 1693 / Kondo 51) TaxID=634177 RepID=G2I2G9_KOMMN|nr:pyruvate kinase [Komagataeibacter medellinensis NBRC 3288]